MESISLDSCAVRVEETPEVFCVCPSLGGHALGVVESINTLALSRPRTG